MQKIIDYLYNRWFHKWASKTKDYQHDRKHVLRHSRHQYFENNFFPAPFHPLYYTILLYVLPKLLGGELDSPPIGSFGDPSPRLYYSIRLYVSRQSYWGWGGLIGAIAETRHMYQGCPWVLSVRNFAIEPPLGEHCAIDPPWGRNNAIISSA